MEGGVDKTYSERFSDFLPLYECLKLRPLNYSRNFPTGLTYNLLSYAVVKVIFLKYKSDFITPMLKVF